jgi:hypothetical protein
MPLDQFEPISHLAAFIADSSTGQFEIVKNSPFVSATMHRTRPMPTIQGIRRDIRDALNDG